MESIKCRCWRCLREFVVDVPNVVSQMFDDETEEDEKCGEVKCPSCRAVGRPYDNAMEPTFPDEVIQSGIARGIWRA